MKAVDTEIVTRLIEENGSFPNNGKLPLLVVRGVFPENTVRPEQFENLLKRNRWSPGWRNGLYNYHHYHSTAHEFLGIYSGWVTACFGGPGGMQLTVKAGDALIIPAGVAHSNQDQSIDFSVIGGYPDGQRWDMQFGDPDERPHADRNIAEVPLPLSDPLFGSDGILLELWK